SFAASAREQIPRTHQGKRRNMMHRRNMLSISAITALGLALMPGNAVSQQKSLKDQLVGAWTLVSTKYKFPPKAGPPANAVFVNGALAVPGAPANTDTVPAKFSAKNAADDELITIAYTFKMLTGEERRTVYQALKGQPTAAFNADVGTELLPGV